MLPVVALVGRPNVGKSTLFNVLTRSRDALVHDMPGVTRDRHYGVCRAGARPFIAIDTGGLAGEDEGLAGLTEKQSRLAIAEADVIVLVLDARAGLTAQDHAILAEVRKTGKPLLLAINKIDGIDESGALAEFSATGVALMLPVAAAHQRGMGALLEQIVWQLPATSDEAATEYHDPGIKVAIVGRPNVGKSTLVNRLLGEERMIASEVPGTTRDAIEVPLERDGEKFTLIDTAGLRRKARVEEAVEKFSVIKTLGALEESHVAVVLIDASEGVTDQDASVIGYAVEAGRALVIAVNKWDGLDAYTRERCKTELDRKLDYAAYAVTVFISAKHGSGMAELVSAIKKGYRSTTREFSAHELSEALAAAYESHQPPMVHGRAAKLRYAHMGGTLPPRVVIHGNRVSTLPDSYKRYLENFFRKRFRLVATPVRLDFRDGANPYAGRKNPLTERQVKKKRRLMRHSKR